jgi:hypothetical protein
MIQNQIQKNEQNKKNELINNNDDGTKSVVLSLETLSKEYDTVLIKYNQAQKDYINYLKTQSTNNACSKYNSNSKEIDQACYEEIWKKSGCVTPNVVSASSDWAKSQEPNYNINAEPLIDIQGATFWGTKGISEGAASSIEQCKAMCSADSSCSGATFNPDKAYCWIRSGDSQITVGMPNDYAIVPENLKYLKIIQGLSEKLTNINQKILQIINQGEPLYTKQDLQRKQQTMILNQNYKKLTEEREKVEKTIKKYQDLNKAQNEGEIVITKNYSTFIAGILIFLIIICLFIKMLPNTAAAAANATVQQGGSLKSNTYILIFIIILITFIICNKILK